jgi:hypothetical protein
MCGFLLSTQLTGNTWPPYSCSAPAPRVAIGLGRGRECPLQQVIDGFRSPRGHFAGHGRAKPYLGILRRFFKRARSTSPNATGRRHCVLQPRPWAQSTSSRKQAWRGHRVPAASDERRPGWPGRGNNSRCGRCSVATKYPALAGTLLRYRRRLALCGTRFNGACRKTVQPPACPWHFPVRPH